MFIVGGVVAGIVVVGHDRHSDYDDYSDYSDYSEYGDSGLVQQVESAKAKSNQAKRSLDQAEETLRAEYQNGLTKLEEKYGDISTGSSDPQDFLREKDQLLQNMKAKMEKDVQEAQKELDEINAAIQKINDMQLKK